MENRQDCTLMGKEGTIAKQAALNRYGMFWVLTLFLPFAGCCDVTTPLCRVSGVVERADSMSRDDALQILKRCVDWESPGGSNKEQVEDDGIRSFTATYTEREVSRHHGVGNYDVVFYQKLFSGIKEDFWAFKDIFLIEDTGRAQVLFHVGTLASYSFHWIRATDDYQALDMEFRDMLAALYKLCPQLRMIRSPDVQRKAWFEYACVGNEYLAKERVVVDNKARPWCKEIRGFTFSPDSQRFAYCARRGHKWYVIIDGKAGPGYDGIEFESVAFSPDSKSVAYRASLEDGKWVDVVNKGSGF